MASLLQVKRSNTDTDGSGLSVASGDGIIIFDADDGGEANSAKKVLVSDIIAATAGAALTVAAKVDGNTLEIDKLNIFGNLNADATVTLPASDNALIGKSIYVKAKNLTNSAKITINTAAADQKVDDENSIVLESPFAAVRLVYVAVDDWRIF